MDIQLGLQPPCDVYLNGVNGVTLRVLNKKIFELSMQSSSRRPNTTLFAFLKHYLRKKVKGFDKDVVHTYIRALVYEPTNNAAEPLNIEEVDVS